MEVKPGYKQTEVGVIPEEWEVHPLGKIAHIERGKFTARPRNDPKFYGGETPFIQTGDVTHSKGKITTHTQTLNAEGLKVSKLFPRGTLFFTIAANIGDVGFATFDAACPDSLVAITPSKNTENSWLAFELAKRKASFESIATHNAQLNINLEKLRPYLLALPPLPEQRAIAQALSDVDALLDGLDRLIAKKRALKQAAMQQLLTGQTRLPGFGRLKEMGAMEVKPGYKQTEVGVVPEEWEVKRLGDLGKWKGGMTPSMQNPDYWVDGTVPWISSGDVKSVQLKETGHYITNEAVRRGTTTMLPAGSIVLVTRSGILRKYLPVATNVVPMAINQDIKALIPEDEISSSFLLHALTESGPRILSRCMKAGTTVESVEFKWLRAFPIAVPPLPEQRAIAQALSDVDALLDGLDRLIAKKRALKQAMMQELLTGKTRLVSTALHA
jgi:type I restriction enzyme, S subunit